jgi:serine/threonine-protein kinase
VAEGGFATVYYGRDSACHGQPVAIKLIRFRPDLLDWIDRRWKLEQHALEALRHPGILQPRTAGIDGDQMFIVTEYIDGATVRAVLKEGRLELDRAWERTKEICEALSYAHQNGILHCDLKPDNIMLRNVGRTDERAVVIDFGTAVVCAPDDSVMDSGRLAGVLDYIAPERIGGKLSPATDVYSLAVTVFEMLTGVRWRDAEAAHSTESLLGQVLLESGGDHRPMAIAKIFRAAVTFDSHARTRTVAEFRLALSAGLGH